ncbi:hypothetical protein FQN57_004835 [Myotisia sp. PD_48]|nr:hypothetical protein FQN57_004835 [Myotisia sp. PD_48]
MGFRDSFKCEYDSLPINLLQSHDQATLLDRIDELRHLGLQHRISLPQLVLCGDRNSGKTSVFAAITGVQLPVGYGVPTRFAVEVVLRRSSEVTAQVKIRPGPNASPDHRQKLATFNRPYNWLPNILQIFSEASSIMGLTDDGTYSQDVLQLEISGSTLPNLTVVDLPGLLHAPEQIPTSNEAAMVSQITETYMKNPRSVILVVVSAKHRLSHQTTLRMTKVCASRTMGIITKLDVLDQDSPNVDKYFARAQRQDTPLQLGWHLLRNLDTTVPEAAQLLGRDDMENLFFTTNSPFKALSSNSVGIESLRNRLGKILLSEVELQLSILTSDIHAELDNYRTSLEKLGPTTSSKADRRLYLTKIGEKFQSLAQAAVNGEYHDPYFRYHPDNSIRRLRSTIRNWAEEFSTDMKNRGHGYQIYDGTQQAPQEVPRSPLSPDEPQPVTRTEFIVGLAELLRQSKGRELSGLSNTQIVGELFLRYSLKWKSMAKAHVFQFWKRVKQFLDDLLHHVADNGVGEAILLKIVDQELEKKLQKLNEKVDELISPYKRVIPSIIDPELDARIRQIRMKSSQLQDNADPTTIDESLCSELLDCMQAYYATALNNFVSNVASLGVENCLVDGLENLASPSRLSQLSDDELESIASESADVKLARDTLSNKVAVLEVVAATCTRCELVALGSAANNHRTSSASEISTSSSTYDSTVSSPTSMSSVSDGEKSPTSPEPPKSPVKVPRHSTSGILRAFPLPDRMSGSHHRTNLSASRIRTAPTPPPVSLTLPFRAPSRSLSLSGDRTNKDPTRPTKLTRKRTPYLRRSPSLIEDRPSPWGSSISRDGRPIKDEWPSIRPMSPPPRPPPAPHLF